MIIEKIVYIINVEERSLSQGDHIPTAGEKVSGFWHFFQG